MAREEPRSARVSSACMHSASYAARGGRSAPRTAPTGPAYNALQVRISDAPLRPLRTRALRAHRSRARTLARRADDALRLRLRRLQGGNLARAFPRHGRGREALCVVNPLKTRLGFSKFVSGETFAGKQPVAPSSHLFAPGPPFGYLGSLHDTGPTPCEPAHVLPTSAPYTSIPSTMALIPQDATATRKLGAVLREATLDAVTPTWRPLPRDLLALSGDGALHARGVRWEERGEAAAARGARRR